MIEQNYNFANLLCLNDFLAFMLKKGSSFIVEKYILKVKLLYAVGKQSFIEKSEAYQCARALLSRSNV